MKPKLKIGIFIDSYFVPYWEYAIIEQIQNSDFAEISLIVRNISDRNSFKYKWQRIRKSLGRIVFIIYRELDNYFFKPFCNPDAFDRKDLRPLIMQPNVIDVLPIQTKHCDIFDENDITRIREHNIDVFLRMGFRILKGKVLESAKYGIWSYQHSDSRVARGRPAGYWEVFKNIPVTGAVLQILAEGLDEGIPIYRSWASTYLISPRISRNHYFLKSSYFVPRKLKEMHEMGGDAFIKKATLENPSIQFYSGKLSKPPSNFLSIYYVFKQFVKVIKYLYAISFTREQWILKCAFSDKAVSVALRKFRSLIPPSDRFWADPHLIFKDDKYFIFIEELIYKTNKGHISVIELDQSGNYKTPQIVLERPYHLSFPFIFEYNHEYYMVPESHQNKTIELWRCISFPDKWEFVMNLMEDVFAIDSTLIFYDNKWWIFTTIIENENFKAWDELFIFYSTELFSNTWTPHKRNPVISDVSRARQAGKIFSYKDDLFRPSQNCSGRYGYGLKLNRIEILNETEYKEAEVSSIEPNWDTKVKGIHSFAYEENLTVVDSLRRIPRFKWFMFK